MVDNNNNNNMSHFDNNLSSSQDEISLFLRQILLRSSSSSSSNASQFHDGKISAIGSTSLGLGGNDDTDDYDCESEEGIEALTEEVPIKSVPFTSKSSSKRSRAAEVHNLSEKRRRSRINEKMKALQDLIPNSNKTDKASMLDEAIEYLKQLQLQVQMLSMRNGLSLHPMCFPEGFQSLQLPRMNMDFSETNRSTPLNITATLPQENSLLHASNLPNKSTLPSHPSVAYPSYINNPQTSFGPESPIPAQKKPFQRSSEPKPIHGEELSQHQQSNTSYAIHSQDKGFELGAMATPQDNNSSQTQRDRSGGIMRISEPNIIHTSQLSR